MRIPEIRFDQPFVQRDGTLTPTAQRWISAVQSALALMPAFRGTGDPNGVVTASPPAFYLNDAGGASVTLYVKESGDGTNTGWVGK